LRGYLDSGAIAQMRARHAENAKVRPVVVQVPFGTLERMRGSAVLSGQLSELGLPGVPYVG
jgi:hypothetical protein